MIYYYYISNIITIKTHTKTYSKKHQLRSINKFNLQQTLKKSKQIHTQIQTKQRNQIFLYQMILLTLIQQLLLMIIIKKQTIIIAIIITHIINKLLIILIKSLEVHYLIRKLQVKEV